MPELYIITGSNGAGKSTVGVNYLPEHIQQRCAVFDGDKLFMTKQRELWASGVKAIKEARKLAFAFIEHTFDNLVQEALSDRVDFVYEGHFTNEATWDVPRRFKTAGFSVNMIFFGLTNTKLSELRVIDRAKEGGHYVDPKTVADNFFGNLQKLNLNFSLFDTLQIIDTSELEHKVLAVFFNGRLQTAISVFELPEWFKMNLPALVKRIELLP